MDIANIRTHRGASGDLGGLSECIYGFISLALQT